jgi:hypothetical protein
MTGPIAAGAVSEGDLQYESFRATCLELGDSYVAAFGILSYAQAQFRSGHYAMTAELASDALQRLTAIGDRDVAVSAAALTAIARLMRGSDEGSTAS